MMSIHYPRDAVLYQSTDPPRIRVATSTKGREYLARATKDRLYAAHVEKVAQEA